MGQRHIDTSLVLSSIQSLNQPREWVILWVGLPTHSLIHDASLLGIKTPILLLGQAASLLVHVLSSWL